MHKFVNSNWFVLLLVTVYFVGGTAAIYFIFEYFHIWDILFWIIVLVLLSFGQVASWIFNALFK